MFKMHWLEVGGDPDVDLLLMSLYKEKAEKQMEASVGNSALTWSESLRSLNCDANVTLWSTIERERVTERERERADDITLLIN